MDPTLLIEAGKGAIVGGLIGWLTNRLAVWMLFHPKKERRVFGKKVPLTPGLVVKNQEKLAEAIGRAVSRDLLDSETLLEHFQQLNLAAPIRSLLLEERKELAASDQSLADLLGPEHRPGLEKIQASIAEDLAGRLELLTESLERGDPTARTVIRGALGDAFESPIGDYLKPEQRLALRRWLMAQAQTYLSSASGDEFLQRSVSRVLDSLPGSPALDALVDLAQEIIDPLVPDITEALQGGMAEYIASKDFADLARPRLARRLYELIIDRYPMAAMFLSEKTIREMLDQRWDAIADEAEALLRHEKLNARISEYIREHGPEMLANLGNSFAEEQKNERLVRLIADELRNLALNALNGEQLARAVDELMDQAAGYSASDIVERNEAWLDEVTRLASVRLGAWLRKERGMEIVRETMETFIHGLLFRKPVSEIVRFLPEEEWEAMSHVLGQMVQRRALRLLPTILREHVDIAGLVTAKIRDFDSEQIEQIILRVSGRELKGIVRLGGVIGLVVGAVMQVIYHLTG